MGVNTQHRRRTRRRSQNDGYEERQTHEDRVQRQIRRQWRLMEMERRQMELAMEQSRRDAFRSTRKQQDEEYQRALKDAEDAKEDILGNEEKDEIVHNAMLSNEEYSDENKDNELNNYDDVIEEEEINLDPLPIECVDDKECVYVRIRLPNGIRSERRFHFTSTIKDVCLWTNHTLKDNKQTHLIGNSQLISTMPHTVYDDMNKDLKALNFWRPHSKRKLVSPLLYVDE